MIPNRIEAFCDLSGFAYLREYQGVMAKGSPKVTYTGGGGSGGHTLPFVVVAEEIDGEDRIVRSWYVLLEASPDGRQSQDPLPHRIVSRDILPGVETPTYDPNVPVSVGNRISEDILRQLQRARDDIEANRERHAIYSQAYLDALRKADGWRGNVEHLNKVVAQKDAAIKERDNEICELNNQVALNQLQIATLQASNAELENRKSLIAKIKSWCRSTLKKCALKRAG